MQSVWLPQPGPQYRLLRCPVEDVFIGGGRGGGKTDGLLGDWINHAARYKQDAGGIFFRKTYTEIEEVEKRCNVLFPPLGARLNVAKRTWDFSGAHFKLRYLDRDEDAGNYQGHSYSRVYCDELTRWPRAAPIDMLLATLRSGEGVPGRFRSSGNPGGVGHNWVKARYIDPAKPYKVHRDEIKMLDGKTAYHDRVFIPALLDDNLKLMEMDPEYWQRVAASVGGNETLLKAWRYGLWDIVAGGAFDDVWQPDIHIVPYFEPPSSWYIDRSFDWGSSHPFSVGWWAESDGTCAPNGFHYPKGTLFRIAEFYGWNGVPNEGNHMTATEIGRKVVEIEKGFKFHVKPGPADNQIWNSDSSYAADMERVGCRWIPADKSPNSRKPGLQKFRSSLQASAKKPMDEPGLFVFDTCRQFIRTVPTLPRSKVDMDDIDSKAEDHCLDGDTLVDTEKGQVPIRELVDTAGLIHGPEGLIPYRDCRMTARRKNVVEVIFEDGRSVVCTPDHKFLTISGDWVEAGNLIGVECRDIVTHIIGTEETQCKSTLSARPSKNLTGSDTIFADSIFNAKERGCISWFIYSIMERFLVVMRFTTKTATGIITKTIISNCGNRPITHRITCEVPITQTGLSPCTQAQQNGMEAMREKHGTKNNTTVFAKMLCTLKKIALVLAVERFSLGQSGILNFVPVFAGQPIDALEESTIHQGPVQCVGENTLRANIQWGKPALGAVAQNYTGIKAISIAPCGESDVYCLDVGFPHAFSIAGGILVHNCYDEARYRIATTRHELHEVKIRCAV